MHDNIIARSPCSRRTSPGAGKQRPYVASTPQVWALCDAVPDRYRAGILLGAFAGLRVAEACGLRVADVDFMRGVIHPAVQYPAEPLKTEVSRTAVPIAASMAAELSAHVAQWRAETLLTNAEHGGQLGPWVLERVVRAARDRAGLPAGFRYHDLRHYFASLLIASGADVKIVQARLRHASATTTFGHLRASVARLRRLHPRRRRVGVHRSCGQTADKRKIVMMSVQVTAPARARRRSTG